MTMREIRPDSLWVGNASDGRDPERLYAVGVVAVVNLAAQEPTPVLPRNMISSHFPIVDGPQDDQAFLDVAIHTLVPLFRASRLRFLRVSFGGDYWP